MVDTLALGASASRREGSSPFIRTNERIDPVVGFFVGGGITRAFNRGVKVRTASGSSEMDFPMQTVFLRENFAVPAIQENTWGDMYQNIILLRLIKRAYRGKIKRRK